eukprot:2428067-Pleurochrysis_carterae.AAC.1
MHYEYFGAEATRPTEPKSEIVATEILLQRAETERGRKGSGREAMGDTNYHTEGETKTERQGKKQEPPKGGIQE